MPYKKIPQEMFISCLIGDPVVQSVSPYMYNYFGQKAGFDYYSHIKLRVPLGDKNAFPKALQAVKTLGFAGINITIPYKVEVLKYLDDIDERAKKIGAVNAIINKEGSLKGFNTDGLGALSAIENVLRKIKQKDKIVIFGSGGAARAIVGTLLPLTKNITILNRIEDFYLAEKMKKDIKKIKIIPLNDENIIQSVANSDFVINATSVGMHPNEKNSILSQKNFVVINSKTTIKTNIFWILFITHI